MKVIVILFALLAAVSANDVCVSKAKDACSATPRDTVATNGTLPDCNSQYGHFVTPETHLQAYVELQVERSFDYLLMSMYFGNFDANREGFQAYYRKLSDAAWEDAIDLIKFITKRGGTMKFKRSYDPTKPAKVFERNEMESLALALDIQKELAEGALHIYSEAQKHKGQSPNSYMDGSIAHYFEEKFIEPQADRVRNLAGHINDLRQLLRANKPSISLFIFDEYLKKSL